MAKIVRRGSLIPSSQSGLCVCFPDISTEPEDKDLGPAYVTGTSQLDLLWEVAYMLADFDQAKQEHYSVHYEGDDVIVAEIDSEHLGTEDRFANVPAGNKHLSNFSPVPPFPEGPGAGA